MEYLRSMALNCGEADLLSLINSAERDPIAQKRGAGTKTILEWVLESFMTMIREPLCLI